MTANEKGKFCSSCQKTVIDFSTKTDAEVQAFFQQNKNKPVCGRFLNSQLNANGIIITIYKRDLLNQHSFQKIFLLALFVAMGEFLFSCKSESGESVTIQKIEVVNDTLLEDVISNSIMMVQ